MIEDAERNGLLAPGATLVEPSSGNTGIGMAMVCRIKGYRLKIVLPGNVSIERRQLLEVWGAEVIDSPANEGSNGAVRVPLRSWPLSTPSGPSSTSTATLPTRGRTTRAPARRSGMTARRSRTLSPASARAGRCSESAATSRSANPQVQVWAVEPPPGETVDGLRNLDEGYIPPIFVELGGAELLDRKTIVGPRDSIEWTRRLADLGIFAGISSGAALAGAVKCANAIEQGTSSSSAATEGGSTSRPAPGPTTSTRSWSGPKRIIYF